MTFGDEAHLDSRSRQPFLVIASLHPHRQSVEACEALVARFGVAPLRPYLDSDGGETCFGMYALSVCRELAIQFRISPIQREKGTYVACFGHAVWLNALAYAVACAADCGREHLEQLLDMQLDEAEGLLVPLYGGEVQKMVVPL
ncbi:MAG: hypothetical protein SGPRY_010379 [Prymnesium sp.]